MKGGLMETGAKPKKPNTAGVQSIIEEHSNLVNLDNLVTAGKTQGLLFLVMMCESGIHCNIFFFSCSKPI